jgi:hypothetical protein
MNTAASVCLGWKSFDDSFKSFSTSTSFSLFPSNFSQSNYMFQRQRSFRNGLLRAPNAGEESSRLLALSVVRWLRAIHEEFLLDAESLFAGV